MNQQYQKRNYNAPRPQANRATPEQNDWKEREIGALWEKQFKSGDGFTAKLNLTRFGGPEEVRVIIMTNKFKEKPEQPDYRVYISEDREQQAAPAPAPTKANYQRAQPAQKAYVPRNQPQQAADSELI